MDKWENCIRPLKVTILMTLIAELGLFVVFGLLLFPQGNLLYKLIWTGLYCGIGMGAATGALIVLIVVERFEGMKALLAGFFTATLSLLACNLLCLTIDQHYNFFGGREAPHLFLWNGIAMIVPGSALLSWLLFTDQGNAILDRFKF